MHVFYCEVDPKDRLILTQFISSLSPSDLANHALEKIRRFNKIYFVVKCDKLNPDHYNKKFQIIGYSFWSKPPKEYRDFLKNNSCQSLNMEVFQYLISNIYSLEYRESLEIYKVIFNLQNNHQTKNSNQNGKNQLQREEGPDSGCGEGSILHGRRNKLEYSAGRHRYQAPTQTKRVGARRYQIYLSVRTPEVLGR